MLPTLSLEQRLTVEDIGWLKVEMGISIADAPKRTPEEIAEAIIDGAIAEGVTSITREDVLEAVNAYYQGVYESDPYFTLPGLQEHAGLNRGTAR
jgi:DNA-binding cell septation regulator SpoVG